MKNKLLLVLILLGSIATAQANCRYILRSISGVIHNDNIPGATCAAARDNCENLKIALLRRNPRIRASQLTCAPARN